MEVFLEIIKTVGFPIACAVFLAWYLKKQTDEYREDIKSLTTKYEAVVKSITEKYEKAIEKFSKSIDKNTLVLTSLETKLGIKEGEQNERQL